MKLALAVALAIAVPRVARACEAPGRPCPVVVCDDGDCDASDDDPAPPPVRIAPAPPESGCDGSDCGSPAKAEHDGSGGGAPDASSAQHSSDPQG